MRPIVLLHGFPLDGSIWNPMRPGLIRAGLRPWAPDLPGFGKTTPFTNPEPTVDDYAEAVLDGADREDIDSFTLVGHSFGGYVALAVAEAAPDRVEGLGMVSTNAHGDDEDRRRSRLEMIERIRDEGPGMLAKTLPSVLVAEAHHDRVLPLVEAVIARTRPAGAIAALHAMASRPDRLGVLKELDVPFVTVRGTADPLCSEADVEAMAEAAGGQVVTLESVGHMPMYEATDRTVGALAALGDED